MLIYHDISRGVRQMIPGCQTTRAEMIGQSRNSEVNALVIKSRTRVSGLAKG